MNEGSELKCLEEESVRLIFELFHYRLNDERKENWVKRYHEFAYFRCPSLLFPPFITSVNQTFLTIPFYYEGVFGRERIARWFYDLSQNNRNNDQDNNRNHQKKRSYCTFKIKSIQRIQSSPNCAIHVIYNALFSSPHSSSSSSSSIKSYVISDIIVFDVNSSLIIRHESFFSTSNL